jgi:hypothetical protein
VTAAALAVSIAALIVGLVNLSLTWFQVIPDLRDRTPGDGILPRLRGKDEQ